MYAHLQISDDNKGKSVSTPFDQSKPEGMRYTQRVVDEIVAVLFDSRRQSCHGLVLNRFIAFSGFKQLLVAFQNACHTLFTIIREAEAQPAAESTEAQSPGGWQLSFPTHSALTTLSWLQHSKHLPIFALAEKSLHITAG